MERESRMRESETGTNLLETSGLMKSFEGVTALYSLSFSVSSRMIKSIIGPNGAGKTTLINLITGYLRPTAGQIYFNKKPIAGLKPHIVASLGVARTFQTVELFQNMTVLENVMVGCHQHGTKGLLSHGFRLPGTHKEEKAIKQKAIMRLELLGLEDHADRYAGTLPLGEQKLLEIARALASGPSLLLLDEPVAGLNESETKRAADMIKRIRNEGITIILVEHDMKIVMSISDEVLVLNYGAKIAEGPPEVVTKEPAVIRAYLGQEDDYFKR
jgi:branched-chain amino acid transport system ATP-binding protein